MAKSMRERIDVAWSGRREVLWVMELPSDEVVFSLHYTELENDINIVEATKEEIIDYLVEHYDEELHDLIEAEVE